MSRQDEIAKKAMRKSTLKSLKVKKHFRLKQLKENYENEVRNINLQYAEDPERLKAKYASEDYAKSEKAKRRAEKRIAYAKKEIELTKTQRRLTTSEEIFSAIVQGVGACLFIAATAILETLAVNDTNNYVSLTTIIYALFGGAMIMMYIFSTLQHALTNITAKGVFNRLSHIWTFLCIGLAYSAYTITKINGTLGWVLFGIVSALSLFGMILCAITGTRYYKLLNAIYGIAGFSGIFACKVLYDVLSTKSFSMLILAAVFYVIGFIFYNLKKVKYMHSVGNVVMLAGSVYMFFSLFFINK